MSRKITLLRLGSAKTLTLSIRDGTVSEANNAALKVFPL
ncbi:hypothetical protein [Caulobacter sp. UNC358MFTsu5.1]|nr:hypothetical protein [Caulobacter sp. UNC358MFTsu5.1]